MAAILVEHLSKTFHPSWPWQQPVHALTDVSLIVGEGEVFGFLGHNGAGKTTMMKILLGLMRPSGGRAEILGKPAGDVSTHACVGYLPESPYFYDYLTAYEFLYFYGRLGQLTLSHLRARVPELLELVGLASAAHRPLRKFSKGMLQRVGLAQALIHDPELVILDEPMSGLDPIGRKEVRDIILGLREEGKTVFFSTHIIPDIEIICDRVGILVGGTLRAQGRVEDLVRHDAEDSFDVVVTGLVGDSVPTLKPLALRIVQQGKQCLMAFPSRCNLEEVLSHVRRAGGAVVSVTPHKRSLEDIFLERTSQVN